MPRLFRTPEGLLDLIGQRVGGTYPKEVSEVVVPTLDVGDLLAGRLLAVETAPSLTSNLGDTVTLTVPDNEVWVLLSVNFEFVTALNSNRLAVAIGVRNLPGSNDPINLAYVHSYDFRNNAVQGVTSRVSPPSNLPIPLALSPGTDIVGEVWDTNQAGMAWTIHASVQKLVGN